MSLDTSNRLGSIEGKTGAVIRTKELLELLGVSRMTLHRWIEAGRFQQPLKANGRNCGFNKNAVKKWMNQLKHENSKQG